MTLDTILEDKLQAIYELGGKEAVDEWRERCGISEPLPHENCRWWDENLEDEGMDCQKHDSCCERYCGIECDDYTPQCRQCSSPVPEHREYCSPECWEASKL